MRQEMPGKYQLDAQRKRKTKFVRDYLFATIFPDQETSTDLLPL